MLSTTSRFGEGQPMHGQAMGVFPPVLAQMVALWMLLAINIPDYTRYVRDQGQQQGKCDDSFFHFGYFSSLINTLRQQISPPWVCN